jgi:hypothetical protein
MLLLTLSNRYDCNGTKAQKWVINHANTKVRVAGTNFCLDAGTRIIIIFWLFRLLMHLNIPLRIDPTSGVGMKIWQCFDGLPAQAWYYTNDNRIALTDRGSSFILGLFLSSSQHHFLQPISCYNCIY